MGVALDLGLEVVAPLPFPVELYEKRFKDDGAKNYTSRIYSTGRIACSCFCLGPGLAHVDFAQIVADDKQRARRYMDVAVFCARHSHAMLALWD